MAKKAKTKDEQLHMRAVADLGCIVCDKMGYPGSPAELHHIISNTGMGKKATNYEVIPCLLYTSPSPRDMRRSRMPSSA